MIPSQVSTPQPQPQPQPRRNQAQANNANPIPATSPANSTTASSARIERPVFIVSAPRSGSSLLFETMLRSSPEFWFPGGNTHQMLESIEKLAPQKRDFDSNRLTAADADPQTAELARQKFLAEAQDRTGQRLQPGIETIRLLDRTPKNALRIPFLNVLFPDALFIYLYRTPEESIASSLEAWRSGKFMTYPGLPGWYNLHWSFMLIPGWRAVKDKSLPEIVAEQWSTTTRLLIEDLGQLPHERWTTATFQDLLANPRKEIERLCTFAGARIQQLPNSSLPTTRQTLSPPAPGKWRKNASEIEPLLAQISATNELARHTLSQDSRELPPEPSPAGIEPAVLELSATPKTEETQTHTPEPQQQDGDAAKAARGQGNQQQDPSLALRSVHTNNLPQVLEKFGVSVVVSTYQSGRLMCMRVDKGNLNTHFLGFHSPMGVAVDNRRMAVGTKWNVWEYRNMPDITKRMDPPNRYDACYLPRHCHFTGDIRIHEIGYGRDGGLWIVNTAFSTLCQLDNEHSFVPRWRPKFITALAHEDRCHLNGMAMFDGHPKYVTALGRTNNPAGWRENKAKGGIIMDVDSGEIICEGLSMPHSPRLYRSKLWVLESGRGSLANVDIQTGKVTTIVELPGFSRGLSFFGPLAFIGLSQVRETNVFGGLPITQDGRERHCGVWIVNIETGKIVAFLRFEEKVQEIFDVQVMAGLRFPEILDPTNKLIGSSFFLPPEALKEVSR